MKFYKLCSSVLSLFSMSEAFSIGPTSSTQAESPTTSTTIRTRRNLLVKIAEGSMATLILQPTVVNASGGATAGGAYLLSAKQRYNVRVTACIQSYLALSKSLDESSLDETKAFFTTSEVGGWEDGSSAGYLLANAFRTSSGKPPDSLPSVKKWKAFAAEQENLLKALKKKDINGVKASYTKSEGLLDAYLEAVELPSVMEMRQ
jgi:hypothetical protein